MHPVYPTKLHNDAITPYHLGVTAGYLPCGLSYRHLEMHPVYPTKLDDDAITPCNHCVTAIYPVVHPTAVHKCIPSTPQSWTTTLSLPLMTA